MDGRLSTQRGREICDRLAAGESLKSIAKDEHMPSQVCILKWANSDRLGSTFGEQYIRAREIGYMKMADEIVEIIDDSSDDFIESEGKDGKIRRVVNNEAVARSRLRFDGRRRLLSKCLPKVFGEKTTTEIKGQIDVKHENVDDLELARWIMNRLHRVGIGTDGRPIQQIEDKATDIEPNE